MDKKEEFKNYMFAGHGRAVELLKGNQEEFIKIVMYGCLKDISFDMQCEGSRGCYMYNLAMQYDDYEYFLRQAIRKFLANDVNTDWNTFCHLCDFIRVFAAQDNNIEANEALLKKYNDMYIMLTSMRYSAKAEKLISCFEYIAIVLMQLCDFDFMLRIFSNIGTYFIRRNRVPYEDLNWHFDWFYCEAKEKYGEDFIKEQLDKYTKTSKEIKRFNLVMNASDEPKAKAEKPTPNVEDLLKELEEETSKGNGAFFRNKAEPEEKIKFANIAVAETDLDRKSRLLRLFTFNRYRFPLDPKLLIEYVQSDNENLRDTAIKVLSFIRADCVHELAVELIDKNESEDVLDMLIFNCRDDDREVIFSRLNTLAENAYKSKYDKACELHGAARKILDTAEELEERGGIIDELVMFAYEKSPCSCCREWAFDELEKRELLTSEILNECLYDANSDLREKAEKLISE